MNKTKKGKVMVSQTKGQIVNNNIFFLKHSNSLCSNNYGDSEVDGGGGGVRIKKKGVEFTLIYKFMNTTLYMDFSTPKKTSI